MKAEVMGGQPVKHISYRRANGALVDLWIAPGMGHAILKLQAAGPGGRDVVTTRYSEVGKGTWYPKRVVFKQFLKERLMMEETATVEQAKLNAKVLPARFSLSSLPLTIGERVKKNGRDFTWDGKKLVDW